MTTRPHYFHEMLDAAKECLQEAQTTEEHEYYEEVIRRTTLVIEAEKNNIEPPKFETLPADGLTERAAVKMFAKILGKE